MNTRLYRSPDDQFLVGVAGGMAEAWNLDPALVRVAWVLLAIVTGGVFIVVYLAMAVVVPMRPANIPLWAHMTAAPGSAQPGPVQSGETPTGYAPGGGDYAPGGGDYAPGGAPYPPPPPPAYGAPIGPAHRPKRNDLTGAFVLGILLILAGGYFLARQFMPALDVSLIWPVVAIALGAVLIVAAFVRRTNGQ